MSRMSPESRILKKAVRLVTAPGDPGIYRRVFFRLSPQRLVYLKQYGERRTGTNFLRTILLTNHANAYPVMHVLGDKHSPPVDLAAALEQTRGLPNADLEFVTRATMAAPAKTTIAEESDQQHHLQKLAHPLAASVRAGRLGYLISTKHPYPWAASLARFRKWTREIDGRCQMSPEFAGNLEEACRLYNDRHRAWLDLHEKNPVHSATIRHEDLLEKPAEVIARLEKQFGLWRLPGRSLRIPHKAVEPTNWDQDAPWLDKKEFNLALYTARQYENQLSPELWNIVTTTIDWELMTRYGYKKTPLLDAKN
jgi:hypothetical protein